ncbi:MAG: hypothetical protein B7Z08_10620 [Sphingomonadales bacterium 32-68-7]|nr:MAG: hypothetical protein B7Z33_05480 [Sphingomonadales bacterium 12-68-11]OYX08161.1 MAG: hypothetical protein B7Z08_10620 [Sphingomonadales bacterium 32-68-7]
MIDTAPTYDAWAQTYDIFNSSNKNGDIVSVEERFLLPVLSAIIPGRAADFACGTGRWATTLSGMGWDIAITDQSRNMLSIAREKLKYFPPFLVQQCDLESSPSDLRGLDLAICSFALCHCKNITSAVQNMAISLRPGGLLVLSDVHPCIQSKWGGDNHIEIESVRYPMPGWHWSVETYRKAMFDSGVAELAVIEHDAIIDEERRLGVLMIVGQKSASAAVS